MIFAPSHQAVAALDQGEEPEAFRDESGDGIVTTLAKSRC
jgi:hypothetical protein